MKTITISF